MQAVRNDDAQQGRQPPPPAPPAARAPSTDSAPELSTFLNQISAGHNGGGGGSAASKTLPLHAQSSLIATQLSNVEDAALKLLEDRNDEVQGTIDDATRAQSELARLEGTLQGVTDDVKVRCDESLSDSKSQLTTSLQAYLDAYSAYHANSLLLTALTLLQPLLQAVEDLEAHVDAGDLDPRVFAEKSSAVETLLSHFAPNAPHAWIRARQAPALLDLEDRLRTTKKRADGIVQDGWKRAVFLQRDAASASSSSLWSISIASNVPPSGGAAAGDGSSRTASLASLAASLDAKDKLKAHVEGLGSSVGSFVANTVLSANLQCETRESADANRHTIQVEASAKSLDARTSLEQFTRLLAFLDTHLFKHLPSSSSSASQAIFSRTFLATCLPLVLAKLRACLPADVGGDPTRLSDSLNSLASEARNIYSLLTKHHFLPSSSLEADGPEDESYGYPSRLHDFADRIGEIYGKAAGNAIRDETRNLLVNNGNDAWDTEEIEVEPIVTLPLEEEEQEKGAVEDLLQQSGGTSAPTQQDQGWGWGDDDDDDDDGEHASGAMQPPIAPARGPLLRTASSSSSASDSASHPSAPRKGKGALGSVRVIRPQDQLGSGPYGDGDDADAWGFSDDDGEEVAVEKPAAASNPLSQPQQPVVVEEEDDAWGFGDGDEGEGDGDVQKESAHSLVATGPKATTATTATPATASGTATSDPVPLTKPAPVTTPVSVPSSSSAMPATDDIAAEEDPWFQEQEQGIADTAAAAESVPPPQATPLKSTTAPLPPSDPQGPLDDDAWFGDEPATPPPPRTAAAATPEAEVKSSAPPLAPAVPVEPTELLADSSAAVVSPKEVEQSPSAAAVPATPASSAIPPDAPATPPRSAAAPQSSVHVASAASTPSQVSDTSFSRSTRHFDLDEWDDDEDDDADDAWGLSDDEKTQRRASKRASRMLGLSLGSGPHAQTAEKDVASSAPAPVKDEGDSIATSLIDDEDSAITPSSSMHLGSAMQATQAPVPTVDAPTATNQRQAEWASMDDDDDGDDDAWGLSAEEQEARNKRRSQLFGALPAMPSKVGEEALSSVGEEQIDTANPPVATAAAVPKPLESRRLTERNLEAADAAAADDGLQTSGGSDGGAFGRLEIPAPAPSDISSASALPPSSPRDEDQSSRLSAAGGTASYASSVISEPSSEAAATNFPIESALPDELTASEAASSNASLPATPRLDKTGSSIEADSRSVSSTTSSVAALIAEQEAEGRAGEANIGAAVDVPSIALSDTDSDPAFPVQSALPRSSAPTAAGLGADAASSEVGDDQSSIAGGPPSILSLPPTPKAERNFDLPSFDDRRSDAGSSEYGLGSSGDGNSRPAFSLSAPISRPYTPEGSLYSAEEPPSAASFSDPPFPIHSAVPYSANRTGPPSVASTSGSDRALPPSPFPERASTPDDAGEETDDAEAAEAEAEAGATSTSRDRSATTTISSVNAENLRRLSATPQPGPSGDGDGDGEDNEDNAGSARSVGALQEREAVLDDDQQKLHDGGRGNAGSNGVTADQPAEDDGGSDSDPWDDFEAQPKSVQPASSVPVQPVAEGFDGIAAKREADTRESTVDTRGSTPSAMARDDGGDAEDAEGDDGWQWGEEDAEDGAGAAASTSVPASAPALEQAAPSSVQRAGPSMEQPQQSSVRNAAGIAAGAAGLAGLAAGSVAAQSRSTQHDADAAAAAATPATDGNPRSTAAAAGPPQHRRMEKSKISRRSRQLVHLAHRVVDDAIRIAEASNQHTLVLPSPALLLASISDIFEMHRALMPSLHRQILTDIPSLSVQFANDCQFLAKEILLLEVKVTGNKALQPHLGHLDLRSEAQRTTLLGKRIFETQMTLQAAALNEHLVQTDSLLRVYEDARFDNAQRVHQQVVHLITSLYSAWASVLNESAVRVSVGTLIEATLQRVWKWILDLDDIGEIEGQRLAELVKVLTRLEPLFANTSDDASEPSSQMVYYVPSWIKVTGYLPEILLGSLADVEFLLFEAGGLDVSGRQNSEAVNKTEARRLIRSTFADTARRRELLARVDRGV